MKGLLASGLVIILNVVSALGQNAQPSDSISQRLTDLEKKLDSLENVVRDSKSRMVTHSDFESILRAINEDDQEFTDEGRRSKRRALDSLFKAAASRPGQLTFTGQFLSVFHWDGKFENSVNTVVGIVDIFAISSFGKNSLVFINLQGIGGDGPSKVFPSYSGFHAGAGSTQAIDGVDRINIVEAWIEYKIQHTAIFAGKIDLTNYFDPNSIANDEYSQFLSNIFVNSAALNAPSNSPGLTVNSDISAGLTLQAGVASLDNSGDQIFENLYSIIQLGKSFSINKEETGAIRAYTYNNSSVSKGWGFGMSGDIRLTRKLYAFGRYGKNLRNLAGNFGVSNSYSGGLQLRNYQIIGSSSISSGFAFGETKGFRPSESSLGRREQMFETYIRFNIKKVLFLSPHFQRVWNALGENGDNLSLFGLRTRVAF